MGKNIKNNLLLKLKVDDVGEFKTNFNKAVFDCLFD